MAFLLTRILNVFYLALIEGNAAHDEKQENGNQESPNHPLIKKPNITARFVFSNLTGFKNLSGFGLIIHRNQKLFIVSRFLKSVVDEIHRFYRIHICQIFTHNPHSLNGFFVQQ